MEKKNRIKNGIVFFGILALAVLILYANQNFIKKNASFVAFHEKLGDILETIRKEISTPGGIIAKIESSRAFLTDEGVFVFTNRERTNNSLSIFGKNTTLDQIAKERLDDMFAKGYFEHVSPTGESASSIADDMGYDYIAIGENIALGNFENDETLVAAWMASPGHRANILNPRFTLLGVAVGKGLYNGRSTWIGVQIFARPASACPKVDANLKAEIDSETNFIHDLEERIEIVEAEIERLNKDKNRNREEYNQKVDEYNALAKEINSRISNLKGKIAIYNSQVKTFNLCIE